MHDTDGGLQGHLHIGEGLSEVKCNEMKINAKQCYEIQFQYFNPWRNGSSDMLSQTQAFVCLGNMWAPFLAQSHVSRLFT